MDLIMKPQTKKEQQMKLKLENNKMLCKVRSLIKVVEKPHG